MFSKLMITTALFGFSTVAFATDDVEKTETETEKIVVQEESAPAPKAVKKSNSFDDDEEEFNIDFSKTAEAKTDFVDDIPLDFDITDDPNNHKATVKRVVDEPVEVETATEAQVKEAKDVEWSFDVAGDEEE